MACTAFVIRNEFAHLVDGAYARQIAVPLCGAPREQPVAAEDDAVAARHGLDRFPEHQRQLETRTLPGDPDDATAVARVELVELRLPVRAGRQSNRPVGMQVIDVIE